MEESIGALAPVETDEDRASCICTYASSALVSFSCHRQILCHAMRRLSRPERVDTESDRGIKGAELNRIEHHERK